MRTARSLVSALENAQLRGLGQSQRRELQLSSRLSPEDALLALIDIIAGARPNFMKVAPIIQALEARRVTGSGLRYRLIHTGQHYDARMSTDFFEQLQIPPPAVNLEVGSGTHAEQTAAIMV